MKKLLVSALTILTLTSCTGSGGGGGGSSTPTDSGNNGGGSSTTETTYRSVFLNTSGGSTRIYSLKSGSSVAQNLNMNSPSNITSSNNAGMTYFQALNTDGVRDPYVLIHATDQVINIKTELGLASTFPLDLGADASIVTGKNNGSLVGSMVVFKCGQNGSDLDTMCYFRRYANGTTDASTQRTISEGTYVGSISYNNGDMNGTCYEKQSSPTIKIECHGLNTDMSIGRFLINEPTGQGTLGWKDVRLITTDGEGNNVVVGSYGSGNLNLHIQKNLSIATFTSVRSANFMTSVQVDGERVYYEIDNALSYYNYDNDTYNSLVPSLAGYTSGTSYVVAITSDTIYYLQQTSSTARRLLAIDKVTEASTVLDTYNQSVTFGSTMLDDKLYMSASHATSEVYEIEADTLTNIDIDDVDASDSKLIVGSTDSEVLVVTNLDTDATNTNYLVKWNVSDMASTEVTGSKNISTGNANVRSVSTVSDTQ